MKVINSVLAVILAATFLISCSQEDDEKRSTPPIPPNVPYDALWIGGNDGGAFIEVEETSDSSRYLGTIYFESSGEIWYQGALKYTGSTPFDTKSPSSYIAWDGDVLLLKNGSKLIALDIAQ